MQGILHMEKAISQIENNKAKNKKTKTKHILTTPAKLEPSFKSKMNHTQPTIEQNRLNLLPHSKLATVVEGDQKAPFPIATTPSCRGGCYSFPWIAPLYPWYVPNIAEY